MQITADVVGRRVTIRHREGSGATDVIGRVVAVGSNITIERRDGSLVDVDPGTIVLWRVVPDRPARSRRAIDVDAETLTRITSRGWPAIESVPLGNWELRASSGFTGRANSVAAVGDPGLPTAEALARVVEFYRERGLPPLAQVIVGSRLESDFVDAGWVPLTGARPGAIVQVAQIGPGHAIDPEAAVEPTVSNAWLAGHARDADPAIARAVMEGARTVGFISIGDSAFGRVVVTGEWAGISGVEVDPAARRQGLGTRIVETALAWAASHGADKAYLQTMRDNHAALALYAPYGFADHHEYRYLTFHSNPPADPQESFTRQS